MQPYAATAPKRSLSPEQQAALGAFYKPTLGATLGLGVLVPLVLGALAGLAYGIATDAPDMTALVPMGLAAGIAALVLAQWLLRASSRRKLARAEFIYQYGQAEPITFAGLTSDYYRRNQRPRTVINLLRGTEPLQIKTFDERIIAAFMPPQQVAYTHPSYPDVLVPGSLLAPGRGAGPRPREVEV